jgi:hypothetical protein
MGKTLEELCRESDTVCFGVTREEWVARCKAQAESYPVRVPIVPLKGGDFSESKVSELGVPEPEE